MVKASYQEENFYYLTGHNESGAALLLVPEPPAGKTYDGPREILLPAATPLSERWNGPRMGPNEYRNRRKNRIRHGPAIRRAAGRSGKIEQSLFHVLHHASRAR